MYYSFRIFLLFVLVFFTSISFAQPQQAQERTVVHAGHVITEAGKPPLHEQSLIIENGRFVAIEEGYTEAENAIDLRHAWVMPGLIDLHTHVTLLIKDMLGSPAIPIVMSVSERKSKTVLQSLNYAQSMLAGGFTTLRNLGDPAGVLFDLRDAINQGLVPGPRIFATQSQIVVSGGDYDPFALPGLDDHARAMLDDNGVCTGVDDCRRVVRQEVRRGADVIKVRISGAGMGLGPDSMLESREELASIIDTAHGLGRTVAVHSHSPLGSAVALELGADTIEHGLPTAENYKLFKRKNGKQAYFVPTLTIFDSIREPLLQMTGQDIYAQVSTDLAAAYEAGVPIAFGTDAGGFPHANATLEFGLMSNAGMSNEDILKAATVNAAAALQKSTQIGSIAVGKWGDLVATAANPLEDIRQLENVIFVMKAGKDYTEILK